MKQRTITGVLAAAVFILFILLGDMPLVLFTFLIGAIALYELLKMRKLHLWSFSGMLSLLVTWIFILPDEYIGFLAEWNLSKIEIGLLAILLYLSYMVASKNKFTFDDVGFSVLSVLYIGVGFHFFVQISNNDLTMLVYSLFIIWATDSGAYFIGRAFGKRKLWPEISPNKTVEGFVGGIVCAVVVAVLFYVFGYIEWSIIPLITIILSIFGQIGDLAESALKRHYGVKDSGRILPGHGGILDRFDSLLFVWPLLYFILDMLGKL
ncbi:phosphatidate cytidylyltransferase [Niallia taxi]|uniref:phosphatidate cytidylyltransferase n=1 Tax=Niallia taxi TaxID=2499688 RepID=UPI0011A1BA1F|nr:phosphatidate cytidylyltransferase [Niallia taxi]MCT2343992.1 phosphatidate cytidylyltransferase [Niallia taxi]MDE5051528.1 phosphatidate cytidylyltransferase [Niallia taxi]MED3964792.1 phosphatidate cytidylyltransferase [Niallia taxi]WOD62042.1 phosphatidate cytidylyltransferase [Niallia taxi]